MMKQLPFKTVLSSTMLVALLALVGCDQVPDSETAEQNTDIEQHHTTDDQEQPSVQAQDTQHLSRGNMFNIARDIAKLQLGTDDYVTLLKQSQSKLEQAIQDKNTQQLRHSTGALKQELYGLHDALLSLDLKSTEVDQIRQSLLKANQQLLNMPLLHGQTDLSKIDFDQIEKQFNSIQMDMVKLATLVLGDKSNSDRSTT